MQVIYIQQGVCNNAWIKSKKTIRYIGITFNLLYKIANLNCVLIFATILYQNIDNGFYEDVWYDDSIVGKFVFCRYIYIILCVTANIILNHD